MPACNSPSPRNGHRGNLIAWSLTLLAGMVVGFWPEAIYLPHISTASPVLPVLETLAVAQVSYLLLGYPLVLWSRRRCGAKGSYLTAAGEAGLMLLTGLPLLIVGAFFSDGGWHDVLRVELLCVTLLPLSLAAGLGAAQPYRRSIVSLLMLLLTVGLPAAWYIATEFVPVADSSWLWQPGPATYAWQNAQRGPGWLVQPLWPAMIYLGAGLAWMAADGLLRGAPSRKTSGEDQD